MMYLPRRLLTLTTVLVVAWWATATPLTAAGSDYAEAMRVRRIVILDPARKVPDDGARIVLPVSRGFDQRSTSLCWAYASLSALETRLRVGSPGTTVELSRRAMQFQTIRDRFLRKIHQTGTYVGERGVAVDAFQLLTEGGLVAFDDFTDIDDPYGNFNIGAAVQNASGEAAKVHALEQGLARVYGVPPSTTHFEGQSMPATQLATTVKAGQVWESFAIATDGVEGYRPHPDPDSRAGARSMFISAQKLTGRIKQALAAGFPLEITLGGHCLLLYGATYDGAGLPTSYFIKDSYPGYFYKADPARIMETLVELTTAQL